MEWKTALSERVVKSSTPKSTVVHIEFAVNLFVQTNRSLKYDFLLRDTTLCSRHWTRNTAFFRGNIPSKTFGCYLDATGTFRFGYIYRNGSNYRVVSWENGQRVNRTVPRWASIFVFNEVTTPYPFSSPNFNANDFTFPWFDPTAQMNLRNALMAWQKMELVHLTSQMAKLSMK